MDYEYRYPSGNLDWCRLSVSQNVHTAQATAPITQIHQRPRRQFSCFIWGPQRAPWPGRASASAKRNRSVTLVKEPHNGKANPCAKEQPSSIPDKE